MAANHNSRGSKNRKSTGNKKWFRSKQFAAIIIGVIVAFTTTYTLILPAITVDLETAEEMNGIVLETPALVQSEEAAVQTVSEEPAEAAVPEPVYEKYPAADASADQTGSDFAPEAPMTSDEEIYTETPTNENQPVSGPEDGAFVTEIPADSDLQNTPADQSPIPGIDDAGQLTGSEDGSEQPVTESSEPSLEEPSGEEPTVPLEDPSVSGEPASAEDGNEAGDGTDNPDETAQEPSETASEDGESQEDSSEEESSEEESSEEESSEEETTTSEEETQPPVVSPLTYHCDYYDIEVSFDSSVQLPAGTKLIVRELNEENLPYYEDLTYEDQLLYKHYFELSAEEMKKLHVEDFTTSVLYELSFVDEEGEDVQLPYIDYDINVKYQNVTVTHEDEVVRTALYAYDDVQSKYRTDLFEKNSNPEQTPVITLDEYHLLKEIDLEKVSFHTYDLVLGLFAGKEIEEQEMIFEAVLDNVSVNVTAPAGAFPEGTTMEVKPVEEKEVLDAVQSAVESEVKSVTAVDITFYDADGNEIQPEKEIQVSLRPNAIEEPEEPVLVHVDHEGEANVIEDVTHEEEEVVFESKDFSVYVLVYTVDFSYEVDGNVYEFSMPGGGAVLLSKLFDTLNIAGNKTNQFITDVENVSFSDISLVWVGQADKNTTVGTIKQQNGLESFYSMVLSENAIDEIDNYDVPAGEWVLISLIPFDSVEVLTVTMKNGDVFTINVTDDIGSGIQNTSGNRTVQLTSSSGSELSLDDVPSITQSNVSKTLTSNGDGTYTLKLSVKIPEIGTSNSNKANIVVILDSSNSMELAGTSNPEFEVNSKGSYCNYFGWDDIRKLEYSVLWSYFKGTNVYQHEGVEHAGSDLIHYEKDTDQRVKPTITRLDVAKTCLNGLADQLNVLNTTYGEGTVELAFVEFASTVETVTQPTFSTDTFKNWVNNTETWAGSTGDLIYEYGATNWEAALDAANSITFSDDDPVYVVFVSDGTATCRNTLYGADDGDVVGVIKYGNEYVRNDPITGVYGTGNDDTKGYNLTAATRAAAAIRESGKTLYNIGIFGDDGIENMSVLPNDGVFYGSDQASISAAFSSVLSNITTRLGYNHVSITDGLTGMTSAQVTSASDFTYQVVDGDGNDITATALTDAQKNASFTETTGGDVSEKGTVQWNLGDGLVINGATYSVSFIVWPDQEAYDLVADLNNGKIAYDSLSAVQKKQVSGSEGNYTLQTNTTAQVDYTPAMEVTTDGKPNVTEGTPGTITMNPPDPMPLTDTTVKVQKKWNVSLAPEELTEFLTKNPDYKVQLTLKKDTASGAVNYITGITIDPVSGAIIWPEHDNNGQEIVHHISTGLMVSAAKGIASGLFDDADGDGVPDDSKRYSSTTFDGTTYYILEKGWDYYFEEAIDADYHFEFEKQIYHPMVVDGEEKDVTFNTDGTIASMAAFTTTLSAVNILKGGINIQKVIVDAEGNTISDPGQTSSFIVNGSIVKDGEGTTLEYRLYGSEYTDENGNAGRSPKETISDSSSFTITIHPGDYIRIGNVPSGYTYTFSETTPDSGSGYEFDSISGTAVDGDGNTVSAANISVTSGTLTGTTVPNAAQDVIIKNKQTETLTGSLKLTKVVQVDGNAPANDAQKQLVNGDYVFCIASADTDISEDDATPAVTKYVQITVTDGAAVSYKIADSEEGLASAAVVTGTSAIISDLDEGDYTITEIQKKAGMELETAARGDGDASAVSEDKTVTVQVTAGQNNPADDSAATATFTNNIETTTVRIVKTWVHGNNENLPTSLPMNLSNGQSVTLSQDNNWEATIADLPKYDTETGEQIVYSWTESTLPSGYYLSGITESTDDTTGVITTTFENTYTDQYNPMTTITGKKIWDDGGVERPSSITVNLYKDGDEVPYQTKTVQAPEGDTNQNQWPFEFTNLPIFNAAGTLVQYTVDEILPEGYTSLYGINIEFTEATYVAGDTTCTIVNPYIEDQEIATGTDLGFVVIRHGNDFVVWTPRPLQAGELDTIKTAVVNASEQFNKITDPNRTITCVSGLPSTVSVGNKEAVSVYMKDGGIWVKYLNPSAQSDMVYGKIPYTYTTAGGEGGGTITNTKKLIDFQFGKKWIDIAQQEIDWDRDIQVTVERNKKDESKDTAFKLIYNIPATAVSNGAEIQADESSLGLDPLPNMIVTVNSVNGKNEYLFTLNDLPYFEGSGDSEEKYTYFVTETNEQLEGYLAPSYSNSSAPTGATVAFNNGTIINQQEGGYALPSTGGPGTRIFTVLGGILLILTGAFAGLILWRKWRRAV